MDAPKTTMAIASVSDTHQLPAVLAMAERVLRAAKAISNTPRMALFGTGLSDPSGAKNLELLKRISETGWGDGTGILVDAVDIVVGAHDLSMLRLMPSVQFGEVCALPACDDALCSLASDAQRQAVEATIECLLRPPPIKYKTLEDLPFEWAEHVDDLSSFRWVSDLWKQSLKDIAKDGEADRPGPLDVLSLCMYAKTASIAFRTTDMAQAALKAIVVAVDDAVDTGLLSIFPVEGDGPRFLQFVEQYLLGDEYPWQVTARGARAAAAARAVLERTFAYGERLASVLSIAKLALLVTDDDPPEDANAILLLQGGHSGDVAKMLTNSLPTNATAVDGHFKVTFATAKPSEWSDALNRTFRATVGALAGTEDGDFATVRAQLAAYTALSSSNLLVDEATKDKTVSSALLSVAPNVVSTHVRGAAAHLSRELVVRKDHILTRATMANIALQPGTSIACTFVTFCPSMIKALATSEFDANSISDADLSASHASLERIAAALDTPSAPLGSLTGIVGGVVQLDGAPHRVVFWRHAERDVFVTFLPKPYLDVAFADYATGSRRLDPNELHAHAKVPFFAADSVLTVFDELAVPDTGGKAFRVPAASRAPLLEGDRATLYDAYETGLKAKSKPGDALALPPSLASMQTLFVREAANDRLAGLRIAWARRRTPQGAPKRGYVTILTSANAPFERISF